MTPVVDGPVFASARLMNSSFECPGRSKRAGALGKTSRRAPAGLRQAARQAEFGAKCSPRFQLPAQDEAQPQACQSHRPRSLPSIAVKVRGEILHHLHLGFASILPEGFDMPLIFNA